MLHVPRELGASHGSPSATDDFCEQVTRFRVALVDSACETLGLLGIELSIGGRTLGNLHALDEGPSALLEDPFCACRLPLGVSNP